MRGGLRCLVVVLCCALLAACGTRPATERAWDEPQLATQPGFRISDHDPDGAAIAQASREWVERGSVPGAGTRWESMSRWALTDIRQMMASGSSSGGAGVGTPAAGAAPSWGYFWPRDGAFLAVALDRTGHHEEARHLVDVLAGLPFDEDLGFDARYLLGGQRVTLDPRGPQSDGCGWVLWALGSMAASSLPPSTAGLRSKCLTNIMRLTWSGWQLPPPSPDYWELPVRQTSLGTVAPMVAGLQAAARSGTTPERTLARDMAKRLAAQVHSEMGPELERFGDHGGLDAAVAMLMPPFGPSDRRVTKQLVGLPEGRRALVRRACSGRRVEERRNVLDARDGSGRLHRVGIGARQDRGALARLARRQPDVVGFAAGEGQPVGQPGRAGATALDGRSGPADAGLARSRVSSDPARLGR